MQGINHIYQAAGGALSISADNVNMAIVGSRVNVNILFRVYFSNVRSSLDLSRWPCITTLVFLRIHLHIRHIFVPSAHAPT